MSDIDELSNDDIFSILGNSRRRLLLYYLEEYDGSADMQTLARHIAATENDVAVDELAKDEVRRVYISLHQHHVPNLCEFGIVDYEEEQAVVTKTDRLDAMMDVFTLDHLPWAFLYLGLSMLALVATGISFLFHWPTASIVAGIALLVLTILSVYHVYSQRQPDRHRLLPKFVEL